MSSSARGIKDGELPSTPHRMDLLPLYSDIRSLTAVPHVTRRYQIATSSAQAISTMHGLEAKEAFATRVTSHESPEKWALRNRGLDRKKFEDDEAAITAGLVGWRLLVDALAYKCGYRPVEWTEEDHKQWEAQKRQSGATSFQAVMGKQNILFEEAGITGQHINIMLSTARRAMANEAAHQMRLGLLACTMRKLSLRQDMSDHARDTMTRVFQWVTGYSIDEVIEAKGQINFVLAVDGLKAGESLFTETPLEIVAGW
ncbi:hypothetical protein K440DRAFT_663934 [Wilcoxina mikolae CBS 423.85]|nr:hypothetical protein K440DRAFT_663934 [Wilcoxina mikolae CBS 423.85]